MIPSLSPKRNEFIPAFPAKSKRIAKRYPYKSSSIVDAIEHFKKQLNKLEHKPKKSELLLIEPRKKSDSLNHISLTISFDVGSPNGSKPYLLSSLPTRTGLPPLKNSKGSEFKGLEGFICTSRRPINLKTSRKGGEVSMNASKSNKIKVFARSQDKGLEKRSNKKRVIISKQNLCQNNSESSVSSANDQTLIDDLKLKYFN